MPADTQLFQSASFTETCYRFHNSEGVRVRIEVETIAQAWIERLQGALSGEEWDNMEEYLQKVALHV